MKRLSQEQKVLRHLKEFGTITPMEAIHQYSITRLAAIVLKLREKHLIDTDMQKSTNKFGEPCNFARYRYICKIGESPKIQPELKLIRG